MTCIVSSSGRKYYYIGKDEKDNPRYYGSGRILKKILKSCIYCEKIILCKCTTRQETCEKEKEFIKKYKALERDNFLNLTEGGNGGNTFVNKTSEEKRYIAFKRGVDVMKNSAKKLHEWNKNNKDVWYEKLKRSIPKRVESYKRSVRERSYEKKIEIGKKHSTNNKNFWYNLTTEQKQKIINNRKLKIQSLPEHRKIELKIIRTNLIKEAKLKRQNNPDKMKEYKQKVSKGVKKYKSTLTSEEKEAIKIKYKITMFKKSGLSNYQDVVLKMISDGKTSKEIFHYLRSDGIKTYHVGIKKYIDFLKTQYTINP